MNQQEIILERHMNSENELSFGNSISNYPLPPSPTEHLSGAPVGLQLHNALDRQWSNKRIKKVIKILFTLAIEFQTHTDREEHGESEKEKYRRGRRRRRKKR